MMVPGPEFVSGFVRKRLRRWLGIAAIQRQIRDLEEKSKMAVSKEDLERLNAATSRIAARVASLLDQIEALGTGNDDAVRQTAQLEAIQQASTDLRPVIEQMEALAADASEVVPEPTGEQVPVEPGPDVAPVENVNEPTVPEAPTAPEPEAPAAPEPEAVISIPIEEATVEEVPAGESITVDAPVEEPITVITAPVESVSGPEDGDTSVVEVPVAEAELQVVPAGESIEVAAPADAPITVITAPNDAVSETSPSPESSPAPAQEPTTGSDVPPASGDTAPGPNEV